MCHAVKIYVETKLVSPVKVRGKYDNLLHIKTSETKRKTIKIVSVLLWRSEILSKNVNYAST